MRPISAKMRYNCICISKGAAFILGLGIILTLMSGMFSSAKKRGNVNKEPEHTLDYLVIGDSESYTSISPMELWETYGYAGFDCGVAGQQIQNAYYQLQSVLDRQSPKVVFMETNMLFTGQGTRTVAERCLNHFAGRAFAVYLYHNEWKNLITPVSEHRRGRDEANICKGYYFHDTVGPYLGGEYMEKKVPEKHIADTEQLYLDDIRDLCREKGITLILYSAPSPKNWNIAKHQAVEGYAKKNGLAYIDMNMPQKGLHMNWSEDTYDHGDHMNYMGAHKTTVFMGKYMNEKLHLPDRRGQSEYAEWNRKLPVYESYVRAGRQEAVTGRTHQYRGSRELHVKNSL